MSFKPIFGLGSRGFYSSDPELRIVLPTFVDHLTV